jgi:hypothetical protein
MKCKGKHNRKNELSEVHGHCNKNETFKNVFSGDLCRHCNVEMKEGREHEARCTKRIGE